MKRFILVRTAALCMLLAFTIAGCDTTGVTAVDESEDITRSELTFSTMPTGVTLDEPSRDGAPLSAPASAKSDGSTSAYGCWLAVRDDDAPRGWYIRSIYLHYPRAMVRQAGGKRLNVVHRLIDENKTEEWSGFGPGRFMRAANCYVPDAEGARGMLARLLNPAVEGPATKEGAGSKAAGAKACYLAYSACVRNSETGELTDCHYTWDCGGPGGGSSDAGGWEDGADFAWPDSDTDDGGGAGGGDTGGGGSGTPCDRAVLGEPGNTCAPDNSSGPRITASAMRSLIEETCGMTLNDNSANHRFGWSAARSLGFEPTSEEEQAVSDGYIHGAALVNHATGEVEYYDDLMAGSLEAKNTNDTPIKKRDQAEREVNKLYQSRQTAHQRARALGWTGFEVGRPAFIVVTTSPDDRLHQNGGIRAYADSKGVPIIRADVYDVGGMPVMRGDVVTSTQPDGRTAQTFRNGIELQISCDFNDDTLRRVD